MSYSFCAYIRILYVYPSQGVLDWSLRHIRVFYFTINYPRSASRPLKTCHCQQQKMHLPSTQTRSANNKRLLEREIQPLTIGRRVRIIPHVLSWARVERPVNGIIFFFFFLRAPIQCGQKTSYELLTPDPRAVVSVLIYADITIDHINVKVIFPTRNGQIAEYTVSYANRNGVYFALHHATVTTIRRYVGGDFAIKLCRDE